MNALGKQISFHDFQPKLESFRDAVLNGLSRKPKQIPPKFFYDKAGSKLFEALLEQPEYYIPHIEKALLQKHADEFAELIEPGAIWIEPGSGSCEKVQLLFERVLPAAYVPMDISGDFLQQSAYNLGQQFPWLPIYAACLDFTKKMILPQGVPQGRRIVFFPGSSLGNLDPLEVQHFLVRIHRLVGKGGGLLIGVDRKKEQVVLNAAYNDEAGITADFNLNLLSRVNNELGGDFKHDKFKHYAYYNGQLGRIEMHLVSLENQQVNICGQTFRFTEAESIHTENSYKYDPDEFINLADVARFKHLKIWSDDNHYFSIYFFEAY
jgi:dimethylhistidine N-methyltransferase